MHLSVWKYYIQFALYYIVLKCAISIKSIIFKVK